MVPNGWSQRHAQLRFENWVLDGPPRTKTVGFCDLLGTPHAPVSKIPSVKRKTCFADLRRLLFITLGDRRFITSVQVNIKVSFLE